MTDLQFLIEVPTRDAKSVPAKWVKISSYVVVEQDSAPLTM